MENNDNTEVDDENPDYLDDSSACSSSLSIYFLDEDDDELIDYNRNSEVPFFDIRSLAISPIQSIENTSSSSDSSSYINNHNLQTSIGGTLKFNEYKNADFHPNFDQTHSRKHNNIDNNKTSTYSDNDIVSIIEINAQISPMYGSLLDRQRRMFSKLETIFEDLYFDTPPKPKRNLNATTWPMRSMKHKLFL